MKGLERTTGEQVWKSWRQLPIAGRLIFCEICKASRFSGTIIADVTTLNFNLLFEIGFSIGLGIPVIPIRDTSYVANKREFDELGLLDTLGFLDFRNAEELSRNLPSRLPGVALPTPLVKEYKESPLYVLKGPIDTEGAVRLMSTLKKSGFRFRTYDPVETPRLTLHEARKQISGSVGVIAHLLSPNRQGSTKHNALCALLGGIAMAEGKVVAMLQEEAAVHQPIDYRDAVQSYQTPDDIPRFLETAVKRLVEHMQVTTPALGRRAEKILEKLDLGDTAAENEIAGLKNYFVPTGQFTQAKQGHARLVVGRKGTGKTAIFYEVRNWLGKNKSRLVLDLKPEGHQFTKLREAVLSQLSPGLQEHTMTGFWNYILLTELAHKVLTTEAAWASHDSQRHQRFLKLQQVYQSHEIDSEGDLSQRLLRQVNRLTERFGDASESQSREKITEWLYSGDIRELDDAVSSYVKEKDAVWLLIDNLDKGWPLRGTTSEDMMIVRALLEATRKLQRQLEEQDVEFKCLVFIRTDIYEHLVRQTPDKGKDTAIRLDWDDSSTFHEIVTKRISLSTGLSGAFRDIWSVLFDSHIGTEDSFNYILERTLMRPRDLLTFLHRATEVAVNRGHSRVFADDVVQAEKSYSEDMVLATAYEIGDTYPQFADLLYSFQGTQRTLSKLEAERILAKGGICGDEAQKALELLLWYGFLGTTGRTSDDDKYSYHVRYNLRHLLHPVENGEAKFVIHPGFRTSLAII
ncbi:MAG: hypothetical protein OJF51_004137 [Nitrospira sp.]|nr:MAG: hypothetical protein OJF51_004137 [Nitrospira sp.]